MIAEALEWCVTPCSWSARAKGYLAAQIAIRHRARRCRRAWKAHLEACRSFVAEAVGAHGAPGHLVILGSGHLNDFDLPFLQSRFDRITLVDVVHPLEIQIRASFSRGRLKTVAVDFSNPCAAVEALVAGADLCVSSCLLSQLVLFAEGENAEGVMGRHLELVRKARRSVLITDVARRPVGGIEWESLLENAPLFPADAEWIWSIAPPGENGPVGEERLVRASAWGGGPH